jgi:hypothetical protein
VDKSIDAWIAIPPTKGVGLKWNFLLLLGISIRKFLFLAISLRNPVKATEAKKLKNNKVTAILNNILLILTDFYS